MRVWKFTALMFLAAAAAASGQTRTWDNGAKTGRWSNPTNWAPDGVPQAGEAVVFDATSLSNCTADTVSNGLGSLTFASAYTGTVTFLTNAVETGMVLTVTGDVTLNAGNLVFTGDPTAVGGGETNRKFGVGYTLSAANLTLAAAASLNADGKGFGTASGPGAGFNGNYNGAGHGGQGAYSRATGMGSLYGPAQGPTELGSGAGHGNGGPGGGALKLVVPGAITVNGRLSANGGTGTSQYGFGGSGGSIWIAGGTLLGSGVIAANSGTNTTAGVRGSGGGRIDLSQAVNNFVGSIEVMGGTNNVTAAYARGLAGSLLLPQSAGTGLTRDAMVVTNVLYFGYSQSFGSVLVTNGGCLVLDANSNSYAYTFDSLVVATNSSVLCPGNREDVNAEGGGTTNLPYGRGVVISSRVVRIDRGGSIHSDGRGFPIGDGPGVGSSENSANYNGGSHGGRGGENFFGGGRTYGTASNCVSLGSGGSHTTAGSGGGAIKLVVGETLTVNGRLSVNGYPGSGTGGGGAGGSIWIASGTVEGAGAITASGTRGGGGGRIDLSQATNNFRGAIEVLSDDGASYGYRGLAGSLMLPRSAGTGLTLDNFVPFMTNVVFGNSVTFGTVTLTNGVMLCLDPNADNALFTFGTLTVQSNATVECRGNYYETNVEAGGLIGNLYGAGPVMMAATVTVARGGRITAEGLGFPRATGPGRGLPGANYVGAGYGGKGAYYDTVYGLTYGAETKPTALGSGGGHSTAGQGGGAITLLVTESLAVDGAILAKGGNGGGYGGGGSGGSLRIEADTLSGTGTLTVAGGTFGGGGGRMSLRYRVKSFTGPYTAAGGTGTPAGGTGTIYEVNTSLANQAPEAPALLTPTNGGAARGLFQMRTLDANLDYLQFKVEIAEDAGFSSIVRTVDQTASQSNWFGQTEIGRTAYAPGATATLVIAPPLAVNSSYYWRVSAIDPGGSASWSSPSAVQSFTTPADVVNTWTATGGLWSAAANWSNRRVPQPGESVLFSAVVNSPCTVDSISNGLVNFTMETGLTRTVTFLKNAVMATNMSFQLTGDLTVNGGALVFGADPAKIGDGTAGAPYGAGYTVSVANVTVGPGASINSDNQGFAANAGPGKSPNNTSGWGASYGGRGGVSSYANAFPVASCYGSAYGPTALGSGGSGNVGGGAIKLVVSGTATVNGTVSASSTVNNPNSSLGAGGSVWITGGTLQGNGVIAANGGAGGNTPTGGGGGRVDISGTANNFNGALQARGGVPNGIAYGLSGSIRLPQSAGTGLTMDRFVLTNAITFGNSLTFTNPVVVTNGGRLTLEANTNENIFTFTSLTIASNGSVFCLGNWAWTNAEAGGLPTKPYGMGITIIASNLTIDAGGALHANGGGGMYGFGPGYGTNLAAAGYGGLAARGCGATYGAVSNVTALGSGGRTGYGGGAIRLIVSGTLTVNGTNACDGGLASWNGPPGAGGSLWIDCNRLEGSGIISANGGPAGNDDGGGGGRVHLSYAVLGETNPVTRSRVTAYGGWGWNNNLLQLYKGAAGTVLLTDRGAGETVGTLIIANDIICSNTVTLLPTNTDGYAGSPLTLTVDKLVLQEKGILQVPSNRALAVVSMFSNGVAFAASTNRSLLSFVAETNSVFAFVGTNDAVVYGSNVFEILQINSGSKIVRFEAGRTNRVQRGLSLDQADLRSTQDGAWWYLECAPSATQNVRRVAVKDSNAGGGSLIVAGRGSSNGGHNVNWQFPAAGGVLIMVR